MPAIVASRQSKLWPPQWKSDKYSPDYCCCCCCCCCCCYCCCVVDADGVVLMTMMIMLTLIYLFIYLFICSSTHVRYNQTRVRAGQQGTCTDSYPKITENPTQYKSCWCYCCCCWWWYGEDDNNDDDEMMLLHVDTMCEVEFAMKKKNWVRSLTVTWYQRRSRTGWPWPWRVKDWLTLTFTGQGLANIDLDGSRTGWPRPWRVKDWLTMTLTGQGLANIDLHMSRTGWPRPWQVKDWLTSTFTRSLTNVKRRGDERLKFRSVANAIRAGIVVDRYITLRSSRCAQVETV